MPFWLAPTHKISCYFWSLFLRLCFFFTHPSLPWVTMPTMVNTMTLLLVVLHYLRTSVAAVPPADDFRTDVVIAIEDICMCLHAILDRVGSPLHLQSLHSLWCGCSRALAILETELFPGTEPSVPSEIDMPAIPRKLTTLKQQAWAHHRPLIEPAYRSIQILVLYPL